MKDTDKIIEPFCELDDDMLETVNGGVQIGDVVTCKSSQVKYCNGCGALMQNYSATITGLRGVLEGKNVYWVKLGCCGYKSSVIESSIV